MYIIVPTVLHSQMWYICKHDNALYLGPQPIPPAPFDPDHCRHEIADFYRHHIRPPGEPILIPLLQNTHSISHHCPRYLSLSLLPTLSLLLHNNSTFGSKVECRIIALRRRESLGKRLPLSRGNCCHCT